MQRTVWIVGLCVAVVTAGMPMGTSATSGGGTLVPPKNGKKKGDGYDGPADAVKPGGGGAGGGPVHGPAGPVGGPGSGGRAGKPVQPGTGSPPPVGGSRGPVTGVGGKKNRGEAGASWIDWWHANRDVHFAFSRERMATTGRAGLLVGTGRTEDGRTDGAEAYEAQSKILFGLRGLLDADDEAIVDPAILAIARSVERRLSGPLQRDVDTALASKHRGVRRSALIALGVLAIDDAADRLRIVLEGGAKARTVCGGKDPTATDRGLAAMSLGLLSDRASVPMFTERLARVRDLDRELAAGLILGAGAFQTEREAVAVALGALLDDEEISRDVRALVPIALGRLDAAAQPFVPKLLRLTTDRDADLRLRHSSVIALGRLCGADDREAVEGLADLALEATDGDIRRAALIALGEALSQPDANESAAVVERAAATLCRALERPKSREDLPWAALGSALLVRSRGNEAQARVDVVSRLRTALEDASDPELQAVFALALGLARCLEASEPLTELATSANVALVRGSAAEGLGLLGDPAAGDTIREQLERERDDEACSSQALALSALGDRRATPALIERMLAADSTRTMTSSAIALGRLGDPTAVDALLSVARDESRSGITRGSACIALGLIGERASIRWNAPFCVGANVVIHFEVQTAMLSIP
ncbi:MAG: HEAT repeat domain-containing protein [Planctomycetes bacterium]|nr:HEAT repeat domain-containing protein [Planctomycetota bacterium]MCC7169367.1 HEAT repeat domain-containing protein [Planctomycetota bacterium]